MDPESDATPRLSLKLGCRLRSQSLRSSRAASLWGANTPVCRALQGHGDREITIGASLSTCSGRQTELVPKPHFLSPDYYPKKG